ncbi:MAG: hypothetical protein ACREEB_06545 [Caulobacteraceae bacterium]
MDLKEIGLFGGGAALALVVGLGAGQFAREPMDRAVASHPMAALPGTQELVASTPEAAPPAPPPATPVRWQARDDTPSAYADDSASATDDAQANAQDAGANDESSDGAVPEVRGPPPDQDYARRDLGGPEEVTPDYTPPPAYNWPERRAPRPMRPPPPPPYDYASPGDGPEA